MDAKTRQQWIDEAYEAFFQNAGDIEPTDPVKALEVHFERNATDELRARCAEEGKTAKACWDFVSAVCTKALHGRNGHVDPVVVYALAMHWWQDVPADWDRSAASSAKKDEEPQASVQDASAATPAEEPAKKPSGPAPKRKKKCKRASQGFFLDVLEGGTPC